MDFETKNSPVITIPRKLFEKLMNNSEMLKFYIRKCSSLVDENEMLSLQIRKQTNILFADQDEKLVLLAGQFDSVLNEIELINYEEGKESNPDTKGRRTSVEECEQMIEYIIDTQRLNPVYDENLMYLSNRYTMQMYAPFCPVCFERAKPTDLHNYRRISVIDKKLTVIDNDYVSYVCKECGFSTENPYYKLQRKSPVVSDECVDEELISLILTRKYKDSISFLSQEIMYHNIGITLSANTMAKWTKEAVDNWLVPVYEALRKELCGSDIVYSDNVMLRGLSVPESGENICSYVWSYCTDPDSEKPIVLYSITPDNSSRNSGEFLNGFEGIMCVDKFECYDKVSSKDRTAGSWAQVRLMFTLSYESLFPSARKNSLSERIVHLCDSLLKTEKSISDFDTDIRCEVRKRNSEPVVDELFEYARSVPVSSEDEEYESELTDAVNYLLDNEEKLRLYINTGSLLADNICSKRSLKGFVGRKGWKFVNLPYDADRFSVVYSLIQTAIANGLEADRYLCYCLKNMSDPSDGLRMSDLFPWNAPQECRNELKPDVTAD